MLAQRNNLCKDSNPERANEKHANASRSRFAQTMDDAMRHEKGNLGKTSFIRVDGSLHFNRFAVSGVRQHQDLATDWLQRVRASSF